ncbi:hypothetical protein B0T22DRAFT_448293 [Podospora appendiculata]|uniref:Uncharacterized protein n=1 Tax=Podospora appendiculata TaxID=314037 RepID=A0AAE1CFP9_9PEZI|nr:hypothetical protein B0T22DRAFT_448293 [Podospora appendiculata]
MDDGDKTGRNPLQEHREALFPKHTARLPSSVVVAENAKQLGIDFETLPKLPGWTFIYGYTDRWHRAHITARCMAMAAVLNRPLEQSETNAIAQHAAERNRMLSREVVPVALPAMFFYNRGTDTWRFPFKTPNPATFNPDVFPLQRFPLLVGESARNSWSLMRFGAYVLLSHTIVGTALRIALDVRMLKNVQEDPALGAVKEAIADIIRQQKRGPAGRLTRGPRPAVDERTRSAEPKEDGSSGFSRPDSDAASFGAQDEQAAPESPAAARSKWQPQQQHQRQWRPQGTAPPPPAPSAAKDDDDFLFDDASPTSPSAQRPAGSPAPSAGGSGGSAWERLRQRGKTDDDSGAQDEQTGAEQSWAERRRAQGSQNADAYSYSQADQDKAYAKEQAQREFDAMLERERRGRSNDT